MHKYAHKKNGLSSSDGQNGDTQWAHGGQQKKSLQLSLFLRPITSKPIRPHQITTSLCGIVRNLEAHNWATVMVLRKNEDGIKAPAGNEMHCCSGICFR